MTHGKIVCSECGVTVAQCRCMNHNNITYTVCAGCRPRKKAA